MTEVDNRMALFTKYLDTSGLEHKQYQFDGVKWCITNETKENPEHGVRGGIIADEMGLGKTIMMIGTIICNFTMRTLVVVPPVLLEQWYNQIYKTTGHKAIIFHGNQKLRITEDQLNQAIIVITTYGAITLTKKQLKEGTLTKLHNIQWNRIIFDEGHHLRNKHTTRHISATKLTANIRWIVTGTPIQNRIHDLYSICSLLGFPLKYYKNNMNLPFILKRTKKEVGIHIPDVLFGKQTVDWTNNTERDFAKRVHTDTDDNLFYNEHKLVKIMRAKQFCIYPKMIIKGLQINSSPEYNYSSKLNKVIDTILERKGNGNGKLIFCHFREEIDEIALRLRVGGIENLAIYDGRTSKSHKFDILNNKNDVLILQIQTACEGLNLQDNYNEIFFISPHWNPAIEDQAIARCHRIGQNKEVYVFRFYMSNLTTNNSIDNYIYSKQLFKKTLYSTFSTFEKGGAKYGCEYGDKYGCEYRAECGDEFI